MADDEHFEADGVSHQFSYAERSRAYDELFGSGRAGLQLAKERALRGELRFSPIRSVCWRLFLGVIPGHNDAVQDDTAPASPSADPTPLPDQWRSAINAKRDAYSRLLREHMIDPYSGSDSDLTVHNPLSQDEDSPWQQFFQNQELQKEINQDIIRTYPDKEFFQRKDTQEMLLRILFIYAKEHPVVCYKQGMHELLAPIVFLLHRERITRPEYRESDMISFINNEVFMEHDSFAMFSALMERTEEWYIYSNKEASKEDESTMSPVVVKCKKIQHILLKQKDPQLYSYLEDLSIEPQLYALRWIRLLFGREFHLEDVLVLWDALFSYGHNLALVDYVCVAMLQYIRAQLLEMDYNMCLRRLFKYPPVEDVSLFVEKAMAIARPSPAQPVAAKKPSISSPPETRDREKKSGVKAAIKQLLDDPLDRSLADLKKEVAEMKETQLHMGARIERIVYILQNSLRNASASDSDMEPTLMAIAELKQIKDILAGLLPPDTVPVIQDDTPL